MSQATYIQDMMTEPTPDLTLSMSEIKSFYAQRNVLITGATGFLGRLLIDRILRSCPKITTLFLLVREKKGKTPEERFKELFDDVIFDRLKRERPGFARKVVLIDGDMMQVDLGLSPEQRELLRSTHIVIHGAATVRFDEKLRVATSINVRGTKELLSLAEEMVDLKAFVHISTAYSHCVSNEIEEKFYPPPIDSDKLINLLDNLDDAALAHLTPFLLGKWPNTYAFTKAVAEDTVRRYCKRLPVSIARPSIVIATWKEPIGGWINNVYGPTGVMIGAAVGILRTLHCDENLVADLIPADYVVNNVIAATWDTANTRRLSVSSTHNSKVPEMEDPKIYNIVSSPQRPITWGQLVMYTKKHGVEVPSMKYVWYYFFELNKHLWVHKLSVIFLHLVPAAIIDSLAWLIGQKPVLWKTYKKIHKFSAVIEFFTTQQWRFSNNNALELWAKMNPADRSEFDLDISELNWEDFSSQNIRGLRTYILNDPASTLPQARVRFARLKVAHYSVITFVCGMLLWLLWTILRLITPW